MLKAEAPNKSVHMCMYSADFEGIPNCWSEVLTLEGELTDKSLNSWVSFVLAKALLHFMPTWVFWNSQIQRVFNFSLNSSPVLDTPDWKRACLHMCLKALSVRFRTCPDQACYVGSGLIVGTPSRSLPQWIQYAGKALEGYASRN